MNFHACRYLNALYARRGRIILAKFSKSLPRPAESSKINPRHHVSAISEFAMHDHLAFLKAQPAAAVPIAYAQIQAKGWRVDAGSLGELNETTPAAAIW
jgi:hypothetical protein